MRYFYANGGIHPFEQSEEGLTLPQWAMQYSGDEGSDFRILSDAETEEYARQQAIQQNGFDIGAAQWAGNEQAMVQNPATGQVELIVNTPQGPMLTSQAAAAGIAGTPLMKPAEESTLSQFTDFGGTLAQLAAMGAGAYGVGSLLGGGLAGTGLDAVTGTVADGLGTSNAASYVAPEAAGGVDLSFLADPSFGYQNLVTDPVLGSGVNATANTGTNQFLTGGLVDLANSGALLPSAIGGAAGTAGGAGTAIDFAGQSAADDAAMGQAYTDAGGTIPQGTGAGGVYGAGTAGGTAAGTALSRILGGTGTAADWAQLGLQAAPGVISAFGSNQQSNTMADLANEYKTLGAPSRARYEASMTPGFDVSTIPGYQSAVDNSMNTALRKLSTQGNPFGNPGGLIEANKAVVAGTALPALQNYQGQNAAAGGFGTYNAAAPGAATASAQAGGDMLSDLGSAFRSVTAPPQQTLSDLLKSLGLKQSTALA